ncbi:MAG: 4-(cytidine 5'-diphospho)-2-C-methyl-D-erythritol kinase [Acidobacteria bacterium]|nr:4-(cytidine 5'-diphospho)-2-C-methyl-D-erythritol kinase [Acidobacteriota bacterium]MYC82808.1 4-(cytidine 5'-diphospho)-2-C-methyl-D-erythritol kinase [Acidobacteriota bacterium]
MNPERIKLRSYAKVNLGLHILGKREDGYHEIRTILQTIGLHDTLEIRLTQGRGVTLQCNWDELNCGDNLVVRALESVCRQAGLERGLEARLEKRIPMGAGLGGGSSNAAAAVMGLDRLLGLRMSRRDWFEIGGALGSDVPFFFVGGRALGVGRGSEVYPLEDAAPCHVLVVVPPLPMPTADAYRRASLRLTTPVNKSKIPLFCPAYLDTLESGDGLENHFETVVFRDHPDLKRLKQRLLQWGASKAGLTGSGSALVGLFDEKGALAQAHAALLAGNVRLLATQTQTRDQYRHSLVECHQRAIG